MAESCRASITKRGPRSATRRPISPRRGPILAGRRGRNAGGRPGWLHLERSLDPVSGKLVRDVGLDRFGCGDVVLGCGGVALFAVCGAPAVGRIDKMMI